MTPTLHVDTSGGNTKWILDGFKAEADKAAAAKADSFMIAGYKNFMTEVNDLNKRMGDLRDTNGDAGAWARIMVVPVLQTVVTVIITPMFRSALTKNMNWTVWTCLPVSR